MKTIFYRRLIRRIRWLLFYQWHSITLKQWPYESCWMCGKAFRVCWTVKDVYWQKIINVSDDSGGSLCVDCFLELAAKKKILVPRSVIKIEIFEPEKTV